MKKTCITLVIIAIVIFLIFWINGRKSPQPQPTSNVVTYFMVIMDEGGPAITPPTGAIQYAGCGTEYAVPISETITAPDSLQEALNTMFTYHTPTYLATGYSNALYQANLTANVFISGSQTIVDLIGTPLSAGHCDTPRFKAQIEETVKYYLGTAAYEIRINGLESGWRCFEDESGECV